jgi:hypothetical protein
VSANNFEDLSPELAAKRVLPTRRAAAFVGCSLRDWNRKRAAGETPTAVELNAQRLGYTVEDLIAWIEARKQRKAA